MYEVGEQRLQNTVKLTIRSENLRYPASVSNLAGTWFNTMRNVNVRPPTPSYSRLSRRSVKNKIWAIVWYSMPWWTEQFRLSWLRNSQQTETCRGDQVADCSRSLDPRRRNCEAHSGPRESEERRGRSEGRNTDKCGRVSSTPGCTCRPVRHWHLLTNEQMKNGRISG